MKKYNIGELIVLIMAMTIAVFIIMIAIGMQKAGSTTPENSAVRVAVLDLIKVMTGSVIGVAATIIASKKQDETKN